MQGPIGHSPPGREICAREGEGRGRDACERESSSLRSDEQGWWRRAIRAPPRRTRALFTPTSAPALLYTLTLLGNKCTPPKVAITSNRSRPFLADCATSRIGGSTGQRVLCSSRLLVQYKLQRYPLLGAVVALFCARVALDCHHRTTALVIISSPSTIAPSTVPVIRLLTTTQSHRLALPWSDIGPWLGRHDDRRRHTSASAGDCRTKGTSSPSRARRQGKSETP